MAPGENLRVDAYIELHCHSCFSFLDGTSPPEALLDQALALGMGALALTDHNGLYGAIRFTVAAEERGVRPIIGAELTLENDCHLVLLAESMQGYRNLCWLITRAQLGGSKGNAKLPIRLLQGKTTGIIALTGCRQGWAASQLLAGQKDRAVEALRTYKRLFAPRHLYVELQRHYHREDDPLVADLLDLAESLALPVVATNNVHYATREGHELQDTLAAIQHNVALPEAQKWLRSNSEYYYKSAGEMSDLFVDCPQAIESTLEIAQRCHLELNFRDEALPPQPLSSQETADETLVSLCERALPFKYPQHAEQARRQLEHELDVIRQTKLAGYFLLVWDIVRFATENHIQARGRGSAANSIVAFLLNITNVDPLRHNLLFERFLSTQTRIMPDIDLDLGSSEREDVIQYVYHKYGESHVGMVCNYVAYRRRSAVRDVGKALGFPLETLSSLAKALRHLGSDGIAETALELSLIPEDTPGYLWHKFLILSQEIQGLPRHLSIHVGGICITRRPLDELVPLEHATMPGRIVLQWNKDSVEDAGLIKTDLLSLRTLSAVDECLDLIERNHGTKIDLDTLPLDDPRIYEALQKADTIGAFQVESRAQQQSLVKSRPRCFADIVVQVALIRPGPIQGNMVHPYLRRRMGLEPVRYPHPLLEPILSETLGVVVFQEQVMRIAMTFGQFSAGEADLLRRAMSRHQGPNGLEVFQERFVKGALAQGIGLELAQEIFGKLQGFAHFGFCKSHAAAFARTTYDTLYLRAYYPTEYYCAIMNNQPMGFYSPRVVLGDARRHGVEVLPVSINMSLEECTVEGGMLRLGLEYVDGLGESAIERILEARDGRVFTELEDFCHATRLPRRSIENLILAGAMAEWERHRRELIWQLGRLRYREKELPLSVPGDKVTLDPMTCAEELTAEYSILGFSASGHLMELLREQMDDLGVSTSQDLERIPPGTVVKVAGLVAIRQAPRTAKGHVFYTLEDEKGLVNVIVRPNTFQAQRATWAKSVILMVQGQLERSNEHISILADRAWKVR